MKHDICGCAISLTDDTALAHWDAMVRAFLAHGASAPNHLNELMEAAPGFAMGHAARGLFCLLMGRRELVATAHECAAKAAAALKDGAATERERNWCAALEDWLAGSPTGAIGWMEACLRTNPHDTLSMKLSHAIRFILGDGAGMRRSLERVMDAHDTDHPLIGYALGCLAFALEETGSYACAETAGREALIHARDDAWGLHAVAHVYDMTHRPLDGIRLIENNRSAWDHCNNFRFHVWWHKALLHLDRGEHDTVLAVYDTCIRDEQTDDYRDFANASSLLLRLELEGRSVGNRWQELADLAEKRSDDGCLVFADLHYLMALTQTGRDEAASGLAARIARDARGHGDMARVMADPGRQAALGMAAFGRGAYHEAFAHLEAARETFVKMGGSHAQRDVFERLTIEAGLRAGVYHKTADILRERTKLRAGHEDAFAESRWRAIEQATLPQPAVAMN